MASVPPPNPHTNLRETALAELNSYRKLIRELLRSFSPHTPERDLDHAINEIIAQDKVWQEKLQTIRQHHELNEECERLEAEGEALDSILLQLSQKCSNIETILTTTEEELLQRTEEVKRGADVNVLEVLELARRFSYTTSAPKNLGSAKGAQRQPHPPFPTVDNIRTHSLFNLRAAEAYVKKTVSVDDLAEAQAHQAKDRERRREQDLQERVERRRKREEEEQKKQEEEKKRQQQSEDTLRTAGVKDAALQQLLQSMPGGMEFTPELLEELKNASSFEDFLANQQKKKS